MDSACRFCGTYCLSNCKSLEEAKLCCYLSKPDEPAKDDDPVHLPHHYARFKIEPIRFIMENNLPFWAGNVIKYTLRYDAKNGIEDLKKARRYLDIQIAKMEGKEDFWR